MTRSKTMKVSATLMMIGMVTTAGCQSVTSDTSSLGHEALDPSTCIAKPPPVDKNGKPMLVTLEDTLSMELRVFFDKNSAELKDKYTSELDKIIAFADRCSNLKFFVQGHTSKLEQHTAEDKTSNTKGSSQQSSSISLASARAQSIKDYLVSLDLPANRIRTFDCGFDSPIASNDTEDADMNQRVYGWMSVYERYNQTLLNCTEF